MAYSPVGYSYSTTPQVQSGFLFYMFCSESQYISKYPLPCLLFLHTVWQNRNTPVFVLRVFFFFSSSRSNFLFWNPNTKCLAISLYKKTKRKGKKENKTGIVMRQITLTLTFFFWKSFWWHPAHWPVVWSRVRLPPNRRCAPRATSSPPPPVLESTAALIQRVKVTITPATPPLSIQE